jgi:hypothetical protein
MLSDQNGYLLSELSPNGDPCLSGQLQRCFCSSVTAIEVVIQASADHREIFILLQHERLIAGEEMRVVGTEVVEEAFHSEAQMGRHFVVHATANHEAGGNRRPNEAIRRRQTGSKRCPASTRQL